MAVRGQVPRRTPYGTYETDGARGSRATAELRWVSVRFAFYCADRQCGVPRLQYAVLGDHHQMHTLELETESNPWESQIRVRSCIHMKAGSKLSPRISLL